MFVRRSASESRTTVTPRREPSSRRQRVAPLHGISLTPCVVVASIALTVVMLVAIGVGSVTVPLGDTVRIIAAHLSGHAYPDPVQDQIIWEFRVPRVLLAALAGAGLALAGVVLQALVANPLADPYILGMSSGASLGAVLAITAGIGIAGAAGVSAAAFAGALTAVVLVFLMSQQRGGLAPIRLVLCGVAVGYVFTALTSYAQLQASPNELRRILFWMLGSVAGASWYQLRIAGLVVLAATVVLLLFGRQLNALVTGDETATALGVDVRRLRFGLLTLSSLVTGTVIAVAGGVGFVGLMIPHLVRLTFGVDHRRVLPLAVLVGANYLVVVDLLSRTVDRPNELPLGIFTAAFGAPFFLWLLRRNTSWTAER